MRVARLAEGAHRRSRARRRSRSRYDASRRGSTPTYAASACLQRARVERRVAVTRRPVRARACACARRGRRAPEVRVVAQVDRARRAVGRIERRARDRRAASADGDDRQTSGSCRLPPSCRAPRARRRARARQPFGVGERRRRRRPAARPPRRHALIGRPAHEVERRQPGVRARQPAGGQHVVGAGHVVAERHRARLADEDRAGIAQRASTASGSAHREQQVLGRVRVRERDRLVERSRHEHRPACGQRLAR